MAVDICSISEAFLSPRISFSHDLNNQSSNILTIVPTTTVTTTTFDFCITSDFVQQITSADELFSGGKLLPTQIKNPERVRLTPKTTEIENEDTNIEKKELKELLSYIEGDKDDQQEQEKEKSLSRSFWRFTRSTSLNCDNGREPKGLFRSLSLKQLLRSNSSDSTLNPRKNVDLKVMERSSSLKEPVMLHRCSSSIQNQQMYYNYRNNSSKRQSALKKNTGGGYDGRIKINPILNIPPTCNLNLSGFGSLFCNGKTKKKAK